MSGRSPRLSGHQEALSDYLDSLLQEVPEYLPDQEPTTESRSVITEPAMRQAPVIEPLPVMPLPPEQSPVEIPKIESPVVKSPAADTPVIDPPPEVPTARSDGVPAAHAVEEEGVPSWARAPFPCLLFTVDGLSLAVPLVHLNGILPWHDDLTPMPNHQPWFLGLGRNHGVNTKVVDTAMVVVPPARRAAGLGERRPFGNMILIGDSRWGLACTAVGEMITLKPDDVRWRSSRGQRPWLAGTVIKEMCALLDTEALADMLARGI